ncbi:MAG: glycosyltransferase family 2 protein [Mucilaginibacter sp.]|uniref:glycosyltransferase family 2 protein n=1 Tax=Mucilaginibacter sp. TaxID=1882438 RepID=UPI0031AC96B9
MKELPLVSIALCTYNGARFLEQQLYTLINQTYRNIEIIAVDDCSTDNTYQILASYASKHPNLRIYQNETNVGFVNNFERALDYCQGDLIAFCDQDDLWDVKKIELQVAAIGDNLILYHDSELINEQNESLGKKMTDLFNFYRGDEPEAFLFFNCVSGHAMLIKKELIAEARPFKKDGYHDWWMAYVATNIGTIDYLPQCLVKYRQHENSDTDLLERKDADKDRYRHQTREQIFKRRSRWLQYCATYPKNKRTKFVKTLYQLYVNWPDSYVSFRLFALIKKHINVLYYISKQNNRQRRREIKKLAWGYKAKNFWYTHIKPDNKKLIRPE